MEQSAVIQGLSDKVTLLEIHELCFVEIIKAIADKYNRLDEDRKKQGFSFKIQPYSAQAKALAQEGNVYNSNIYDYSGTGFEVALGGAWCFFNHQGKEYHLHYGVFFHHHNGLCYELKYRVHGEDDCDIDGKPFDRFALLDIRGVLEDFYHQF